MKKRFKSKKIILILILFVVLIGGLITYLLLSKKEEKKIGSNSLAFKDNLELEINEKIEIKSLLNNLTDEYIITPIEVDTSILGEQALELEYTFKNEKRTIKGIVNVVDKNHPLIENVKDITIIVGSKVDLLKGIIVSDNSKENILATVDGEYDVENVGEYNLKYIAIDSSNNKTEKDFKLIVKEKGMKKTTKKSSSNTPSSSETKNDLSNDDIMFNCKAGVFNEVMKIELDDREDEHFIYYQQEGSGYCNQNVTNVDIKDSNIIRYYKADEGGNYRHFVVGIKAGNTSITITLSGGTKKTFNVRVIDTITYDEEILFLNNKRTLYGGNYYDNDSTIVDAKSSNNNIIDVSNITDDKRGVSFIPIVTGSATVTLKYNNGMTYIFPLVVKGKEYTICSVDSQKVVDYLNNQMGYSISIDSSLDDEALAYIVDQEINSKRHTGLSGLNYTSTKRGSATVGNGSVEEEIAHLIVGDFVTESSVQIGVACITPKEIGNAYEPNYYGIVVR